MDKQCEIRRISTLERVCDKIATEMIQPVGIVLFGADCELKDRSYMTCVERIPNLATGYGGKGGNMGLRSAKYPFQDGRPVLTVMDGNSSGDWTSRFQIVTAFKEIGAKTVVGIYAKYEPPKQSKWTTPTLIDSPLLRQAKALLEDPPTADEFDYFVMAPQEKEG